MGLNSQVFGEYILWQWGPWDCHHVTLPYTEVLQHQAECSSLFDISRMQHKKSSVSGREQRHFIGVLLIYDTSTPASRFISKESDVQSVRERVGFVTEMDHSTLIGGTRKHSSFYFSSMKANFVSLSFWVYCVWDRIVDLIYTFSYKQIDK
jgi:hypothetical protein